MPRSVLPPSRRRLLPALGLVLAAGAAVLWRTSAVRAAAGRITPRAGHRDGGPPGARRPWTCPCGQAFLVSGRDRHTIFWLEGAAESDALLSDTCPSCERSLIAEYRQASPT
jgi:hypothetical protein